MEHLRSLLFSLTVAVFVAGKVAGPLVAWSWWWLLMPFVPTVAYFMGWA